MNGKRKFNLIIRGGYMHTFFPVIQKDELLFSIYARYHERSLNKSENKTIKELHLTKINPLLPENIQCLIYKLKYFDAPDIDYFLNIHTMYNYISNFISPTDIKELYQYMTKGTGKIGAHVSDKHFSQKKYLKYCPDCIQKDFELLGETHWRLSHQLPTLFVCMIHEIPLKQIDTPNNDIGLNTIIIHQQNNIPCEPLTKKTLFYAKQFAKQSYYLNKMNFNLYNKIQSQDFYRLFIERGFVSDSVVHEKKLDKEIVSFFGSEFLELAGFNQEIFKEISIRPLFFSNSMTPIEILVLINFFYKSLSGIVLHKNSSKRGLGQSLLAELLV
ncbi:hypothetical protein AM499_17390 [Bacillus sp. FJAT-22090]|uniref:TniQ family protein n=1 Tax=Bacillus sp. FJAT-22090 TaxID=1581038 RepID=UPI0006AFC13C|nr:TniQ family protein [Bacillus sp. FJAT-22090]ALC87389.1 hypothetical protein AM499_17390 [Bacillus sp. FJAT-22090]